MPGRAFAIIAVAEQKSSGNITFNVTLKNDS